MNNDKLMELVNKAKLGDYDSAMKVVSEYKGYATYLMNSIGIVDKVGCYDEIIRTILNCIIKF